MLTITVQCSMIFMLSSCLQGQEGSNAFEFRASSGIFEYFLTFSSAKFIIIRAFSHVSNSWYLLLPVPFIKISFIVNFTFGDKGFLDWVIIFWVKFWFWVKSWFWFQSFDLFCTSRYWYWFIQVYSLSFKSPLYL